MKNNIDINRNKRLFESMIAVAAEEAMIKRLNDLPSREELDKMYPPSPELNNRIAKIIAKDDRQRMRKKFFNGFMKVAASFGIIFMVGAVTLMSVEASRNIILNAIISIRQDHVVFEFVDDELNEFRSDTNLSERFDYIGSNVLDHLTVSIYQNSECSQILVSQHHAKNLSAAIDTDYRDFTTIHINNHEIFLFESVDNQEHHVAMWQADGIVFQIHTYIDINEMFLFIEYMLND